VGMVHKSAMDYSRELHPAITMNFSFSEWDPNPWKITQSGASYIAFSVITGIMFFYNSIYCGYYLVKSYQKFGVVLAFICLSLEWLCNVLRVIQIILFGMHNNFLIPGVDILVTLTMCMTLITSIIISFFWLDIIVDPNYRGKFFGRLKFPILIFILFCLGVEISLDIRRHVSTQEFWYFLVLFYAGVFTVVSGVNFVSAWYIQKKFNGETTIRRRIVPYIIASGITALFGVVILLLFLSPLVWYPVGLSVLWFLLYFYFFVQSRLNIYLFKCRKVIKSEEEENKERKTSEL